MPDEINFGPFRLDRAAMCLWRGDDLVEIQPRPLAVLAHLAARPGILVTRADLVSAIWDGAHVSRSVVKVAVRAVREALEDAVEVPEYLETVGRQGYRFLTGDGTGAGASRLKSTLSPAATMTQVVGRTAEFEMLGAVLDAAGQGRRQLVFVTGEAGIGKTTLLDEFLADSRTRVHARTARGQCLEQYAAGEAYLPLHDALRQLCEGPERGEVLTVLRRYAPAWLAQQPALLPEAEQQVRQGATQERLLREIAEAIEALAVGRPLVLVLEDLHWSDASTIELVARLAQRREDAQLVIIGTYRPTDLIVHEHLLHDVKRELSAKGLCSELALELLSAAEVAEYLGQHMEDDAAATLGREVHSRTEGNPLFMASVVRELLAEGVVADEDGVWQLRQSAAVATGTIPEGVRGLIEKQFARLRPEQQAVLEVASLTGGEFAAAAVAAGTQESVDTVDELCEELAAQGQFVEEVGLAEWPDGTASGRYRFRHALFGEVLSGRVAGARRVRVHRLMGEREEAGYGVSASEHAAELAVHFAAGRQYAKAAAYHDVAGERAAWQSAHREAAWHVEQALMLTEQQAVGDARPEAELGRRMKLGMSLTATRGYTAPDVERAFARALELSGELEESAQLLPAYRGLREFYLVRGELTRAQSFSERMLRVAENHPEIALQGEAQFSAGSACFYLGEIAAARQYFERSLEIYGPEVASPEVMYGHDPAATALSELASVLWLQGYPDQARARSGEAIALVRGRSHPFGLAHSLAFDALIHQFCGATPVVAERVEEVEAIATEHGFPHWLAMATLLRGWVLAAGDDPAQGIEKLRFGMAAYEAVGADLGLSYWRAVLAETHRRIGASEEGLAVLTEAFERVERTGERVFEPELHRLRGELTLVAPPEEGGGRAKAAATRERRAEAERCFQRAIEIAKARGARSLELRGAVSLARLWRLQRKPDEAQSLIATHLATFDEGFESQDLRAARRLADGLPDEDA